MRQIVISLKRGELAFDIDMITYKIAKSHLTSRDSRDETAGSLSTEIACGESDRDYISRLIEEAMENIRSELAWCCQPGSGNTASDMSVPDDNDLELTISVHDDSKTGAQVLCTMIHDYVVSYCVYRHLLSTAPAFAASYATLAENAMSRIYNHVRNNEPTKRYCLWR